MLENDRMEAASTEVTTTQKNPRGDLIDILSILKVKSTSKFLCRIEVRISKWIRLSKSM